MEHLLTDDELREKAKAEGIGVAVGTDTTTQSIIVKLMNSEGKVLAERTISREEVESRDPAVYTAAMGKINKLTLGMLRELNDMIRETSQV